MLNGMPWHGPSYPRSIPRIIINHYSRPLVIQMRRPLNGQQIPNRLLTHHLTPTLRIPHQHRRHAHPPTTYTMHTMQQPRSHHPSRPSPQPSSLPSLRAGHPRLQLLLLLLLVHLPLRLLPLLLLLVHVIRSLPYHYLKICYLRVLGIIFQ